MNYILDTHYILWSLFEPSRIDQDILAILKDTDATKTVSGISFWEISLKFSLGKLELFGTNPDEIYERTIESGLEVISVENRLFASYYKLPKKDKHKDPFDRVLVWQAIQNDLTLITKDIKLEEYIEDGLKIKLGR
jgi:PIN domain nuclease of toxin-antitoxin system